MNPLKSNFKRNTSMVSIFYIGNCKQVLDNKHLVYCEKINKGSDIKYENILNETLVEQIEALQQVKSNEEEKTENGKPETPSSS